MAKPSSIPLKLLSACAGSCSYILILSIISSFFGKYWWAFDLTSHFRVQYALLALPLIITLFLFKRIALSVTLLSLSLVNAYALAPHLMLEPLASKSQNETISAVLINVNTHLGSPQRVEAFVLETNPDFVILQEISSEWISHLPNLQKHFPYQSIETREDNFGIGLFSQHPLTSSGIKYIGDSHVPSISTSMSIRDHSFNLIATHTLPPKSKLYSKIRNEQLDALAKYAASKETPVLLLGDLNITPFSYHFEKFVEKSGLIDSSEQHGIQPSWPTFLKRLGIPIDHALHTSDIEIIEKQVGSSVGSDHLPIIINFYVHTQ
jgi:endonuclease/exonuclease/phosphatase (EEP) superfamily protein YafD